MGPLIEKRKNILTEDDIESIAVAIHKLYKCECPIEDPQDLREAVKFFKNINSWFDGSKRTIWNTLLVALVMGILALISLGVWNKHNL